MASLHAQVHDYCSQTETLSRNARHYEREDIKQAALDYWNGNNPARNWTIYAAFWAYSFTCEELLESLQRQAQAQANRWAQAQRPRAQVRAQRHNLWGRPQLPVLQAQRQAQRQAQANLRAQRQRPVFRAQVRAQRPHRWGRPPGL